MLMWQMLTCQQQHTGLFVNQHEDGNRESREHRKCRSRVVMSATGSCCSSLHTLFLVCVHTQSECVNELSAAPVCTVSIKGRTKTSQDYFDTEEKFKHDDSQEVLQRLRSESWWGFMNVCRGRTSEMMMSSATLNDITTFHVCMFMWLN